MEFLRMAAKQASENFKDLADEVWEYMGDSSAAPKSIKDAGRTLGKYALTAQLCMMLDFPDDAPMFRDTFNLTGKGPTGARGFRGALKAVLENTSRLAVETNEQAHRIQGFSDISSTSTFDDLRNILPAVSRSVEEGKRGTRNA